MPPARFEVRSADAVRALIASLVLEPLHSDGQLGDITLEAHQRSAVTRLEAAIDEFGGALLADDVGMGKTFVAAAMARGYSRPLVVAPSVLRPMWSEAQRLAGVTADFVSFEGLSRSVAPPAHNSSGDNSGRRAGYDFMIVDECHHVRTPSTRRFRSLASIARDARVLLLSATPIHNSRRDLVALLSLFLGSRAASLTENEMSRCVVRRERPELHLRSFPNVQGIVQLDVADDPGVTDELLAMPPPLPPRDGGAAGPLVARGLIHQWASSEAALREAVNRRLAKGIALTASLYAGRYPTAIELATWQYGDGAIQLGFPELLAAPVAAGPELLATLDAHITALRKFRDQHRDYGTLDGHRADLLRGIRLAHPDAKIVAFAQYAATISMFYDRLKSGNGVAMLTANGARVAGGALKREDALDRFSPRARGISRTSRAEQIDLLLTTDLLSEGVNLQDAEVVVHLDLPWTAARMGQRVGRAARMGSAHAEVFVYLLRPPASAAAILENEILVQRKWMVAKRVIGVGGAAPFAAPAREPELESPPALGERVRRHLERWRVVYFEPEPGSAAMVATIAGNETRFVAMLTRERESMLVAGRYSDSIWRIQDTLAAQLDAVDNADGDTIPTISSDVDAVLAAINGWVARFAAATSAGLVASTSAKRKELLQRIDSIVERSLPHERASLSAIAMRARSIATMQHGPAIERELGLLGASTLDAATWLDTIAALGPREPDAKPCRPESLRIRAVLLVRQVGEP